MLDIFAQFATDETRENDGVAVTHGDAEFIIGRTGNRKYIKLLAEEVEKNKGTLDAKDESAEKASDKIMVKVLSETVLLGWKGVAYKGAELPYSKENAAMLLGHKDFRRLVSGWADDINLFKLKSEEDQTKNS